MTTDNAAVDRGDTLEPVVVAPEGSDESPEALAAEALAAEKPAEEPAAEAKADDAKPRDEGGKFAKKEASEDRIPKERFDAAVGKERAAREAAEARAVAAEARVKQEEQQVDLSAVSADIKKMNAEYSTLILDGETAKAADLMERIQMAIEYRAEKKNEARMNTATTRAVEQVRWDAAVASLEAAYPVLNPDSEQYDQDLTDIVIAEQTRLMRENGVAASAALRTAAVKICTKFQRAVAVDNEGEAGLAAAKKTTDRKAEQVKKNLSTAAAQPGSMKESGKDSDKGGAAIIDGNNITKAEFEALPATTKARLRGDFL